MTILVTGASGLIGSHLCKRLVLDGHHVVGMTHSRVSPLLLSLQHKPNFKLERGDICSIHSLNTIIKNNSIRTVFHLAAHLPYTTNADFVNVNMVGTAKLLMACRDNSVRELVYASSMSVYSSPPDYIPVHETHPTCPSDLYGMTKLSGETICCCLKDTIEVTIVRYSGVYGAGMDNRAVDRFFHYAITGKPIIVFGTGEHSSDFVFVDDAVQGTILAWENKNKKYKIYNIGSGQEITIARLASTIVALTESPSHIVVTGTGVDRPFRFVADINRARSELGYSPDPLLKGLHKYWEEMRG